MDGLTSPSSPHHSPLILLWNLPLIWFLQYFIKNNKIGKEKNSGVNFLLLLLLLFLGVAG